MWPFGKKKKQQRAEPHEPEPRVDPLDRLLEKYGLVQAGERYYDIGKTITSSKEGEWYVKEKIEPLFRQLEIDYRRELRKMTAAAKRGQNEAGERARMATASMDEKTKDGRLQELNSKIEELRQQEKEIELLVFQEKMLNKLIKEAVEGRGQDVEQSDHDLEDALGGESKSRNLEARFRRYRRILHRSGFFRHSGLYPPKAMYVRLFFGICIVLTLGEIGLSMKVVKDIIGYDKGTAVLVAVIYSTAVSLTLAILFKQLIDNLLHRNVGRILLFWLFSALLWLLLAMLFSTYKDPGDAKTLFSIGEMPMTQYGIILGSFSLFFALANAFVFREAAYLDHLYSRMHGAGSVKEWQKRKEAYVTEQLEVFAQASREQADAAAEIEELEEQEQSGMERIGKLKQECIASLWKGYKDGMQEAAAAREDLMRTAGEPLNIDEL